MQLGIIPAGIVVVFSVFRIAGWTVMTDGTQEVFITSEAKEIAVVGVFVAVFLNKLPNGSLSHNIQINSKAQAHLQVNILLLNLHKYKI